MEEPPDNKKSPMYNYARYSSLVFQLMAAIGLGVWGGIELDKYFGTKYLFTLVLLFVALVGGFYWVFKDLKKNS